MGPALRWSCDTITQEEAENNMNICLAEECNLVDRIME